MKPSACIPFLILLLVLAPAWEGAGAAAAPTVYQCAMHPWIKSDHPGKCTICGMELAPNSSGTGEMAGVVALPASAVTAIGMETSTVAEQPLTRTLRVAGRIDDDDTRHRILSARTPGRVEKLHVTYVGATVA